MHKGRPGLRFGQKLNSGAPRALDPSRLVGTIEDFGLDEADRSPTSTKPNKTQGPWSQVPWVILRRGVKENSGQTDLEKVIFPTPGLFY